MPTIPSRYSASGSRQSSDTSHRRRANYARSTSLAPRAESFNPALIPLLPVETISAHNNVYIHPRRSLDETLTEQETTPHDMTPAAPEPSALLTSHVPTTNPPLHQNLARQQTNPLIPAIYKTIDSSPAPGAVAGITLGAVAGFLVLFWLFFTLIYTGRTGAIEGDESEIVIERHHSQNQRRSKSKRTHRSSHHSHREMSEAPPQRPPPPASRSPSRRRTERIVVEETTRRTERSQPPPMSPRSQRETVIEESRDRRVDGDDVVEVIEEHSDATPPRRKKSSGYRTVDPNEYAGGNYPRRDVDPKKRSTRR